MPQREVTLADVREIRWLRRCGLTLLEIERTTGIGHVTVCHVVSGKWRNQAQFDLLKTTRRCPGCGQLVHRWPCLACKLRGQRHDMPEQMPERVARLARLE